MPNLQLGNLLTAGNALLAFPNKYSFNFDGSNDYLDCGDVDGINGATKLTITAWMKRLESNDVVTVEKSSSSSLKVGINLFSDGKVYANLATGSGSAFGGVNLTGTDWNHISYVFDGTQSDNASRLKLYVNGAVQTLSFTGTIPSSVPTDSATFKVGKDTANSIFSTGYVDEVAIWDTALSADDVAKIASKPVDLSKPSKYATDRTSNLKLWLRAGDKAEPESTTAIARQDFYTDFDSTDDYIDVGSDSSIDDIWTGGGTITGWINIRSAGEDTSGALIIKRSSDSGWYISTVDVSGDTCQLRIVVRWDNWATWETTSRDITFNEWIHIAVSYDNSSTSNNPTMYINGVSVAVTEVTAPSGTYESDVSDDLYIGGEAGAFTTDGAISNLALHQTILDAQTISQMAKSRFIPVRDNRFSVVDFDGANDYIATNADSTLADATYTFWAKANTTGFNRGVFGHGGQSTGAFHFNWANDKPLLYMGGTRYRYWDDNSAQDDGQWHHWAIILDADDMTGCKLYIDGIEQTTDSTNNTGDYNAYTTGLEIGRSDTSNEWEGSMAQFAVYSDLKDDEFIYAQWSKGITADYSNDTNLTGYWRMGDDTSKAFPTIADSSSNSNDGTITNGASDDIVQQMVAGYDLGAFEGSEELGADTFVGLNQFVAKGSVETVEVSGDELTLTIASGNDAGMNTGNLANLGLSTSLGYAVGDIVKLQFQAKIITNGSGFGETVRFYDVNQYVFPATNISLTSEYQTFTFINKITNLGYSIPSFLRMGNRTGTDVYNLKNFSVQKVLQSEVSDTYPAIIDVNEPVLGADQVTNGTFDADSNWTKGTGWSIGSEVATCDGTQTGGTSLLQTGVFTLNKIYQVTFDLTRTAGNFKVLIGSTTSSGNYTTNGTHTFTGVATGNDRLYLQGDADFIGTVDNVVAKQILGNVGTMTNQDSADLVYSSVLPDQSFLTGVNSAYNFIDLDGTDAFIDCGEIDISGSEITLSAWVYRESTATDDALAGKWNSNGSMLYAPSGGTNVRFHINANVSTATLPTGAWTHVVGTLGDGFRKLYINGEVQDTDADTNSVVSPSGDFYIGRGLWSGGKQFLGNIGQVAYYNKMLTATEVNAVYNLGRHGNLLDSYSDNLKGYWVMGGLDSKTGLPDTDSTIYDRSGNSNHGTTSGTATGDLKSPPNAEPNGYAKGDTNRSTTTP